MIILKKTYEPEFIKTECPICEAKLIVERKDCGIFDGIPIIEGRFYTCTCENCEKPFRIHYFRESLLMQKIKRFLYNNKLEKHNETSL